MAASAVTAETAAAAAANPKAPGCLIAQHNGSCSNNSWNSSSNSAV
jgi:hypothetical protein